jgi:hypothetical protein
MQGGFFITPLATPRPLQRSFLRRRHRRFFYMQRFSLCHSWSKFFPQMLATLGAFYFKLFHAMSRMPKILAFLKYIRSQDGTNFCKS